MIVIVVKGNLLLVVCLRWPSYVGPRVAFCIEAAWIQYRFSTAQYRTRTVHVLYNIYGTSLPVHVV